MANLELVTIKWFDNKSQEGMVRRSNGDTVYINNDPVCGYRLNNGSPLELKSGDGVYVKIHEDYNWKQVSYYLCKGRLV